MANDVFKGIMIVGTSNESFSKAIEIAIDRAQQTLRELRWFEVREQRGAVRDGAFSSSHQQIEPSLTQQATIGQAKAMFRRSLSA